MTSLKTDLLEKLKKQEASIKLHQIQLIEEIEFELEKKRRLEKDGSVIKLRTQLDELMKIIETPNVPNNYKIILHDKQVAYQNDLNNWHENNKIGKVDKERQDALGVVVMNLRRLNAEEAFRIEKLKREQGIVCHRPRDTIKDNITIKEYMNNLSEISPYTINSILSRDGGRDPLKNLVNTDLKEKVYYDILPLFTTIIGIIEKQQTEIDTIKKQKEVTNVYARAKLHH
jgi:hypothetical protein